jgi:hypothetical protein
MPNAGGPNVFRQKGVSDVLSAQFLKKLFAVLMVTL